MKTIEVSDDIYEALQRYAKVKKRSVDDVVDDILIATVVDPMLTLSRLAADKDGLERYRWFARLLQNYNAQEIQTLEDVARTDEGFTTDMAMAKVLKRLADFHYKRPEVLADLYRTFEMAKDE